MRQTRVIWTDDVDGSEASCTVAFALEGVSYEIDLSAENATELRAEMQRWVEHARRVGGRRRKMVTATT